MSGEASTVVILPTSTPETGFMIEGVANGDGLGFAVAPLGDVNGDGFDDVIVSAPWNDAAGADSGTAYVLFGHDGAWDNIDLAALDPAAGFAITAVAPFDLLGVGASGAGDVNGDGYDDILIGAPYQDAGGANSGVAWVIFGHDGPFADLSTAALPADAGYAILGDAEADGAGYGVGAAGDVNGDGFDDLIVGAPWSDRGGVNSGAAWIVLGHDGTQPDVDLSGLGTVGGYALVGDAMHDSGGAAVSSAGDFNGDGFADVLFGVTNGDDTGPDAGEVYVVFGHDGPLADIPMTGLDPAQGIIIRGAAAGDVLGYSVAPAGDVNGDGVDDIVIGAIQNDSGGTDSGGAWVIFGKTENLAHIDLATLDPAAGFLIQGDAGYDWLGRGVAGAGDVNGDGFDDVIVGAPRGDDGARNAGEAYVIFGHAGPFGPVDVTNLDPGAGFILRGDREDGEAGTSVANAGDLNGDGADDLIVGAYAGLGAAPGRAYVVWGVVPPQTLRGTEGDDDLIGGAGNDWIAGMAGNDTLTGLGGADELYGGDDIDTASYAGSPAGVTVDLAAGTGTGGHAEGDTLGGIENVTGSDHADSLAGDGGANRLDGGAGDDLLAGGAGDDVLVGGAGADALDGGDGADTAAWHGSPAGVEVNLATGLAQGGDAEGDTLAGIENLVGSAGNDLLTGDGGRNRLDGGLGADRLAGNGQADTLSGGAGRDTLLGGAGADLLAGGTGADKLKGNGGVDTFWFETGDGRDTILDFDARGGVHDLVDLDNVGAIRTWKDLRLHHLEEVRRGVLIEGGGVEILLKGVDLDDLDRGDFLF